MRTIKFKVGLSIGYQSKHEEELEIEVEDDATEEEIEEQKNQCLQEWAYNFIETWHCEI